MQVKRIVKWLFGFVLALCVCGGLSWTAVSADVAFDNVIQTEIKEINNDRNNAISRCAFFIIRYLLR